MEKIKLNKNQFDRVFKTLLREQDSYTVTEMLTNIATIYNVEQLFEYAPRLVNNIVIDVSTFRLFSNIFSKFSNIKKYERDLNSCLVKQYYTLCSYTVSEEDLQDFFKYTKYSVSPSNYCRVFSDNNRKLILPVNYDIIDYIMYWTNLTNEESLENFIYLWCKHNIDIGNTEEYSKIIHDVHDISKSNNCPLFITEVIKYVYDRVASTSTIDKATEQLKDILIDLCESNNTEIIQRLSELKDSSIEFCETFYKYLNWSIVSVHHDKNTEFVNRFSDILIQPLENPDSANCNKSLDDDIAFKTIKGIADIYDKCGYNMHGIHKRIIFKYICNHCETANEIVHVFDMFKNEGVNEILLSIALTITKEDNMDIIKLLISKEMMDYFKERGITYIIQFIDDLKLYDNASSYSDTLLDIIFNNN